MAQLEAEPVIDALSGPFDTAQIEDAIINVVHREILGVQVQLFAPDSPDALVITEKDQDFLEFVQKIGMTSLPQFGGFNACNDIKFGQGKGYGWHIDTLEDWMNPKVLANSFNGLSAHKTRRGNGSVDLRLGSTALLELHLWLAEESADNALLSPEALDEPRFAQFISGTQWSGDVIPGRWTLFSHGVKQIGQLPLWHLFSQPSNTEREATAVFYDTATTDTSHVHFSGMAQPVVAELLASRSDL
jgi:hypothetical protein